MQDFEPAPLEISEFPVAHPEPTPAAKAQRSALLIVFLVMFIDLLGFGIVLPLLPRYGKDFLEPLYPGESQARTRGAILGLLMASFSAMQFLFAPIWGRISDRAGRRPFLLLGLAGSVLFYGLFGFASEWGAGEGHQAFGLTLLFLARIGAGIAGATVSTAQAVIADSTTPEHRSRGMALIGAAFGIGFTFGPILGAGAIAFFPAQRGGPGYVASGCSLIALVLGMALMPETLRPGVVAGHRHWVNWHGLRTALRTPTVGLLILTFFLSTLAFATFEPTLALLTQDILRYGEEKNFLVFAYVGLVLSFAQGGLYQTLARRGMREISFMLTGGLMMILGLGGLGVTAAVVAPTPEEIYRRLSVFFLDVGPGKLPGLTYLADAAASSISWLLLIGFLASVTLAVIGFAFVTPSVQALISRRSDPMKQGEILGVNQSANALSRILGPMAGVGLYYLQPSHVTPYAFSVCLLAIMLMLALRERRS
jgi:MFS transporter, DHA1 family, tetracycline resistance protein